MGRDSDTSAVKLSAFFVTALVLSALVYCLLTGCYEHVSRGKESTYQAVWWLGPVIAVGGILGIPIGWCLRKGKLRSFLLIMSPILLLLVAPAMYSDRVVIDDEHFEAGFGFWFNPSVHNVRFDDLREIRYVTDSGWRRTKRELHCLTNAGHILVVPAGDLVIHTVPEILARAKARGVRVVRQPF